MQGQRRASSAVPAAARRRPARFGLAALLAFTSLVLSCRKGTTDGTPAATDAAAPTAISPQGKVLPADSEPGAGGPRGPRPKAAAEPQVKIPAGAFVVGSTPGDRGRDPTLEPAMLDMELGGYTIDRWLFPNDPSTPPMTGVTRQRASELCQERGARLCTELEWERACKGSEGTAYAGSPDWDAACAKEPASCASGFGVLGMGGALREWTASDVAPIEKAQPKAAAVRGARADASGVDHRCAHRAAVDATASSDDLGFRCCGGPPNAATIPSPQWQQTFRKVELSAAQARDMLSSVPELEQLRGDIEWFKEPDDVHLVLERGDAGAGPPNTILTTSPVLWNPVPGEEILVLAGRAGSDSFVVAFHRLPKDRYRIGSVFRMKEEKGPVVLGYNGYVRRKLAWSTCWDCQGESGNVTYREDNRVVITQK